MGVRFTTFSCIYIISIYITRLNLTSTTKRIKRVTSFSFIKNSNVRLGIKYSEVFRKTHREFFSKDVFLPGVTGS